MIIIPIHPPQKPLVCDHRSLSYANEPSRFRAVAPLPFCAPAAVT